MMWMTHVAFGLFLYALLAKFGIFPRENLLILLVSLGALIPDIDHPKSYISHVNFWFRASSRIVSLGGHRGITHTIWAAMFSFPIALLALRWLGIGGFVGAGTFFLGYLSHLIADSLTVSGVAWFYPFDKHRLKFLIRTGSVFEVMVFILLLLVSLPVLGLEVSLW